MAQESITESKTAAPYIAYQTIKSFVAPLKEHVIPGQIDRSLMRNFSGAVQTQLMTALRFLQLIDHKQSPTDLLKGLVEAYESEKWSSAMAEVLRVAYSELFALPLKTVTPSQFNEAFKKAYPCEGETLRKGVTFFLNAARDAEIELSPFLTKGAKPRNGIVLRRRTKTGRRSETREEALNLASGEQSTDKRTATPISAQLLAKFPDFDPAWPDDLKAKWFEGYEKLLKINN